MNRALALFGMEISRADHLMTFDGLPTRRKLEMLTITERLPAELHGFLNSLKQGYTLEFVSTRCRPTFAHEFALARLKARGLKLAVASNSVLRPRHGADDDEPGEPRPPPRSDALQPGCCALSDLTVGGRRAIDDRAPDRCFIVCVRTADEEAHHVEDILRMISPKAVLVSIKRPTAGAACSALLAVGRLALDEELVIVNATDQYHVDFVDIVERFRASGADGGLLSFESLHPRYSYVRLDAQGNVAEVAEKRLISREANAGFYWLRHAGSFFEALQEMILKDAQVNGEVYVALALNALILKQKSIKAIALTRDAYIREVRQAVQPLRAPGRRGASVMKHHRLEEMVKGVVRRRFLASGISQCRDGSRCQDLFGRRRPATKRPSIITGWRPS